MVYKELIIDESGVNFKIQVDVIPIKFVDNRVIY